MSWLAIVWNDIAQHKTYWYKSEEYIKLSIYFNRKNNAFIYNFSNKVNFQKDVPYFSVALCVLGVLKFASDVEVPLETQATRGNIET